MDKYIKINQADVAALYLKVKPNSKISTITGFDQIDGKFYLKVNVKEAPENGKANIGLIEFLSKMLKIRAKDIELIKGLSSKYKVLIIKNMSHYSLKENLIPYIDICNKN